MNKGSMPTLLLLLCLIGANPQTAPASGKSFALICPQPNEAIAKQAKYQQSFWQPSGQKTVLYIADAELNGTGCDIQRLPFNSTSVQWASLVPTNVASQLDGGIILEGRLDKNMRFLPDNVAPLQEIPTKPEKQTSKPLKENRKDKASSSKPTPISPAAEDDQTNQGRGPSHRRPGHPAPKTPTDQFEKANKKEVPFIKSGWIWQPAAWQESPEATLDKLKRWGMKQVYITVPVNSESNKVETPGKLAQFLQAAHQQGVEVWAVDGDRFALLPKERLNFVNRAKAYAAFNANAETSQHIDGLQYDIEPYLVSGYGLEAASWNQSYIELLKAVKSETHLPLEVVLPFWFNHQKAGRYLFLSKLVPWVDGLSIMDYRTDSGEIKRFAEPYLQWGVEYGKPVQIALETGPLPDTPTQTFHPAISGQVFLLRKNHLNLLVLLDSPIKTPLVGRTFNFSHQSSSPARQTTFHGEADRLDRVLKELKPLLSPWPSFAGMAIHGID